MNEITAITVNGETYTLKDGAAAQSIEALQTQTGALRTQAEAQQQALSTLSAQVGDISGALDQINGEVAP